MSISFSFSAKPQSSRTRKTSDDARTESSSRNYVTEFHPADAPPSSDSKIKPIAPIPNKDWRATKKLKNLPYLPSLTQSNGDDSSLQFVLDTGSNPEATDGSMGYGLNIRQPTENGSGGVHTQAPSEKLSDFELRRLREDLENLPEGTTKEDFDEVPVEGFGASLLSGYGWKEGRGIGRRAKEDVKVSEVTRKIGRGGLGFTDELPDNRNATDENGNENGGRKGKEAFRLGKEVRIVNGRDMGNKCKIVEVKSGGDVLVVRLSRSNVKVKVRSVDVADVGSAEEEKCLRKLKELKIKESKAVGKDRNISRKTSGEGERVNWLRNDIRVRIISDQLKGGKLYLKKGVVVDVVGPGVCDVLIDESRELVQEVGQNLLETSLPKRGGSVLVLYGKHKGLYGNLVEKDSENETGIVRDADSQELLGVKLDQIAEYVGDLSEIGY